MNGADFEAAYELLAAAIDEVGPESESAFLTRLVLLLTRNCPDLTAFEEALAAVVQAGEDENPPQ
jgi:hypothetical protein